MTQVEGSNDVESKSGYPPFALLHQHACARLADILQHGHKQFKVANVKDWQVEPDNAKMPDTIGLVFATSLAIRTLIRGAHASVQGAA